MKRIYRICLNVLLILVFTSCGLGSNNSENTTSNTNSIKLNSSDPIESVILHHLDYQYEINEYPQDSIYSKEFIESQKQNSRKGNDKPYKLISYRKEIPVNNTNATVEIDIRVSDKLGEYIQHISLVKNNKKYLIISIDNDI